MCGDIVVEINTINNNFQNSFRAKIADIPNLKIPKRKAELKNINLSGYTAFIGGDVYTPSNNIMHQDLLFKDNKLIGINDFDENNIDEKITYIMAEGKTITPSILDEHIHGGYGVSFHDSSESKIRWLLKRFAKEGIGGVVATTLPGSLEHIKNQIKLLNNIITHPDKGSAKIYGIHLEGPFINPEKRGIHPAEDFYEPTVENFKALEAQNVKIVTLAPELDKDYKLSKYLKTLGINVSAGHSMASAEDVRNSGATQVTHIFNAMAPFHHRKPTIANEGLLNPDILAEMNTDTALLDPQTMNLIMREKPKDKLVMISDALPYAGIKKPFIMNDVYISVDKNWVAKDKDGTLAGSMRFMQKIIKILLEKTNLTFKDFIRYACVNPAKNIGVENEFKIKKGLTPNFTLWDNKTVKIEKTFVS